MKDIILQQAGLLLTTAVAIVLRARACVRACVRAFVCVCVCLCVCVCVCVCV